MGSTQYTIHDVKREDYDNLPFPEQENNGTRWKAHTTRGQEGSRHEVTWFPEI